MIAAVVTPKRMLVPLALLASGIGTFALVGLAGLSVIERYLIVAALALLVFAAVALGGFTMLRPGSLPRRAWALGALALVVYGLVFTVTRVNPDRFVNELRFRGDAHAALEQVLRDPGGQGRAALRAADGAQPQARAGRALGRGAAGGPRARARGRRTRSRPRGRRSTSRAASRCSSTRFTDPADPPTIQVPPAGFRRVATSPYYAAYVRC